MSASPDDDDLTVFCRQVRSRSRDLQQAMSLIAAVRLNSVSVGLLRQELDSMIRVIFLLTQSDRACRARLISDAVNGQRWTVPTPKGKWRRVTDKDLVAVADLYQGWVARVYGFGCSFIHLSEMHDHLARDPFQALPRTERDLIVNHLNYYHQASLTVDCTFADVVDLAPRILSKISANLSGYIGLLEANGDLAGDLRAG